MKKIVGLMALAVGLSACSLFQYKELPDFKESEVYRHELRVDVNEAQFYGTAVVKRATEYKVRVYPPGKVDRIAWRTCSQEQIIDKPDVSKSGWFGGYSYIDFVYKPAFGVDDVNACPLKIEVLEEKKRRNGMALVEFEDAREEVTLFADLVCNGQLSQRRGVSICQSAAGLYQKIAFPSPAIQRGGDPKCDVMKPEKGDERFYLFVMAPGECVYTFVSNSKTPNGKRMEHRLTTIGYTDVPPIK